MKMSEHYPLSSMMYPRKTVVFRYVKKIQRVTRDIHTEDVAHVVLPRFFSPQECEFDLRSAAAAFATSTSVGDWGLEML